MGGVRAERQIAVSVRALHPRPQRQRVQDQPGVLNLPYEIHKLKSGRVSVTSPHGVKARSTSMKNAKAQIRLLYAKEHGDMRRRNNQS